MRFATLLLAAVIAFGPGSSWAADAKSKLTLATGAPSTADIKPLKDWQEATKAHVEYIGNRHGLDMWIATRNASLQLIYTTPDRQAMLLDGNLLGPDTENATADMQRDFVTQHPDLAENMLKVVSQTEPSAPGAARQAIAQPGVATPAPASSPAAPASKSERLWQDLASAKTISFGAATAPAIYMIADLTCDHCKDLWKKLQPAIDANQLSVKLIPIAILGKEAQTAGATALSQPDPAAAWLAHVKGDKVAGTATAEGAAALAGNQALAARYKLLSTPVLIYRDHANDKVKLVFGNPTEMTEIWTDLGVQPSAEAAKP